MSETMTLGESEPQLLGVWAVPGSDVVDCPEGAAFALVVAEYAVE